LICSSSAALDQAEQLRRRGESDIAGSVEAVRYTAERRAPLGESGVGGEEAGPPQIAVGRSRRAGRDLALDPFRHEPIDDCGLVDRPEVDPGAPRGDRDQVVRHEIAQDEDDRRLGWLFDRLEQHPRAIRRQQVELLEYEHLAIALDRSE
jgi:hypothetical protein